MAKRSSGWSRLRQLVRYVTPPVVLDGVHWLLHREAPSPARLRITYEAVEALPENLFNDATANARGTHLNEGGHASFIHDGVIAFDLEREIKSPPVSSNLMFIDEVVSSLLPANATLVDVGCGVGRYERFLHRDGAPTAGWEYSGVDLSEGILQLARRFCPGCEFRSSNGDFTIPYPDNAKDLVMASGMLQYTCDRWLDSLREMKRVARMYILITRLPIVRKSPPAYCLQTVAQGNRDEIHYFKVFSRQEFEAAVAELGCRVVARDYSTEILSAKGIAEPVILNQYLLAK